MQKEQFFLAFRLLSVVTSSILGYLLIIVSSRYKRESLIFTYVVLFLFSISPIQIIIGSTINPYIYVLLAVVAPIVIFRYLPTAKSSFLALFLILSFIGLMNLTLLNRDKIHLLIDYKDNKISIFDSSFTLLEKKTLPNTFLHTKQIQVGPDMSPLSILAIHDFSHCNFTSNLPDGPDIKEIYTQCRTGEHSNRKLNKDYWIYDKRLVSLYILNRSIFININPFNWNVPIVKDGLNITERYSLFTIQASSLYPFSPPGFNIWGKGGNLHQDWWAGIKRIEILIDKGKTTINYMDGITPQNNKLSSFPNGNGFLSSPIHYVGFATNVSSNTYDPLYPLVSFLFIALAIFLIFVKIKMEKQKRLYSLKLLFFIVTFSLFLFSETLLILLSYIFLFSNAIWLTYFLNKPKKMSFELGVLILVILLSSLSELPYTL